MLRLFADGLIQAFWALNDVQMLVSLRPERWKQRSLLLLPMLTEEVEKLEFEQVTPHIIALSGAIERSETSDHLSALIDAVRGAVVATLSYNVFICLAKESDEFIGFENHFGESVHQAWPSITKDVDEAAHCLIFERYTAGVFHLMRVLEIGLGNLAKSLKIPAEKLDRPNWKNLIDLIEKAIAVERAKSKKTKAARQRYETLAEVATTFWHVKDAWRNHVAHARATYDETDAWRIYSHTKALVGVLVRAGLRDTGGLK